MTAETMAADILFRVEGAELRYAQPDRAESPPPELFVSYLEIARGERIVCIGPNGSGKTTLLKALNGLLRPARGRVSYRGEDAHLSRTLRATTVYLHQHPYILAGSVAYNVAYGCRARGMPEAETSRRVRETLELLGLSGFSGRRHRALSGGEAQRVALARALAPKPEVLLLDEPTASVDAASAILVRAALRAAASAGTTIVISTHDHSLMDGFATRRLKFSDGAIITDTPTASDRSPR